MDTLETAADALSPCGKKRPLSLKARAVQYLARREYSRAELRSKLRRYLLPQDDPGELERVLDELQEKNLLSETRYAESRVRTRSGRFGNARLEYELRQQGVPAEAIAEALEPFKENEAERALALWRRRFSSPADTPKERAKQIRYLLARGFSFDTVQEVLRLAEELP